MIEPIVDSVLRVAATQPVERRAADRGGWMLAAEVIAATR